LRRSTWFRRAASRERRRPYLARRPRPGRRAARTGSQLSQSMRRCGTRSMPAFRSVVSVLVRFVRSRVLPDNWFSVEVGHTARRRCWLAGGRLGASECHGEANARRSFA
jgi:hypothetical protein